MHYPPTVFSDLYICKSDALQINSYLEVDLVPLVRTKYSVQATPYDGQLLTFLPDSKTLVYDSHKFLFLLLFLEAQRKEKPLRVIHIDRHWDSKCTQLAIYRASQRFKSVSDVFRFVKNILHEGDFLTAACAAGLVEEITFVVPCYKPDIVAKNFVTFSNLRKISHYQDISFIESITDTEDMILDIDLDYFLDITGRPANSNESFARLFAKQWQAVGVALSPMHLGGINVARHFFNSELSFKLLNG